MLRPIMDKKFFLRQPSADATAADAAIARDLADTLEAHRAAAIVAHRGANPAAAGPAHTLTGRSWKPTRARAGCPSPARASARASRGRR